MKTRNAFLIIFLPCLLVLTGCATTHFYVTVQNQTGQTIDRRTLKAKDLPALMDDLYSSLVQGDYDKCRGLAGVVKGGWPSEPVAVSDALRISSWATLLQYRENLAGLTSLEKERRNLLILQKAYSEFAEARGPWGGEARVVTRAIDARLFNRPAFNAFVKAMRTSADRSPSGREAREQALAPVRSAYPDWFCSVDLGKLAEYPWRKYSE